VPSGDGADTSLPADAVQNLVTVYSALSTLVLGDHPLGEILHRLAHLGRETIPGADDVSVTLIERGQARSVAFTGALAITLDERQYQDGFGPCMDAARTGDLISIEDTTASAAYADFAKLASEHGIQHTLSLGIPGRGDVAGAINIYGAGSAGPFSRHAKDIASAFAGYAGVAVLNAAAYFTAVQEAENLRQAMNSRAEIEQAKGIVMRDQHCTADEAFAHLRQLSMDSHQKLRTIATQIIAQHTST